MKEFSGEIARSTTLIHSERVDITVRLLVNFETFRTRTQTWKSSSSSYAEKSVWRDDGQKLNGLRTPPQLLPMRETLHRGTEGKESQEKPRSSEATMTLDERVRASFWDR